MLKWLERTSLLLKRDTTLGVALERLAKVHGNAPLATFADGTSLTYADAADRVARLATTISQRITEPGEAVVIATPNTYDVLLLCLAASRAGAVPAPVNPKMTESEIDHVISDSGAKVVVRAIDDVLPADEPLAEAVRVEPSDVAAYFYTSGTTGKPKGAELTHTSLLATARNAPIYPSEFRRDEAVIALPIAHIMGFAVLVGLASAGIPVFFMERFRPDDVLDAIEQRRATMFVGVPAMYRMLDEAGAEERDLRSVRVWASGADVMPHDLARKFQRMGAFATLPTGHSIGEALFVEGYGMVETGGSGAVRLSPPGGLSMGDMLGIPVPPYRFKVVDDDGDEVGQGGVGELLIKGPGVLRGYHGDPDATKAVLTDDGWLRTGDLVRKGPFGLVAFAGRAKDVIKVGGYSVYAVEVQAAIEDHPAVAEASVVGVADDRDGERVVAAVRLLPGQAATEDDVLAFAKDRLSGYKVPKEIKIVHELPRTGTDKVKREAVRELFAG